MPPWVPLPGGPYGPELPFSPFEPWGPANRRPPRPDPRSSYSYYRAVVDGVAGGWVRVDLYYPAALPSAEAVNPKGRQSWPGAISWNCDPGSSVGGQIAGYWHINKSTNQPEQGSKFAALSGSLAEGEQLQGPSVSYDFSNRPNDTNPVDYSRPGAPNPSPGAQNNGDPDYWPSPAGPEPVPEVSPFPLVPLPAVPIPVPTLPPIPRPAPVPQPAPLSPSTPALPNTAPARQPNTEPLFTPRQLPAPLATPAPATRTLTGSGRLPAIPAPGPATTPEEERRYGPETIPAPAPRPDLQYISVEVARIEQKLGIMLQRPPAAPDWTDAILNRISQALADQILDALLVDVPATSYEFVAPCDKGETGDPLTLEQEIPAADYPEAVVARLDAIAGALGVLKGWKQPVCRASPPKSNVTVTAYEVGGEF